MNGQLRNWMSAVAVASLGLGGTALAQSQQQPPEQQQQQQAQQQQQQAKKQELSGTVSSTQGGQLYVETKQGAVVPFEVGQDAQYKGQTQEGEKLSSTEQLQAGDQVRVSFSPSGEQNQASEIHLTKSSKAQKLDGKVQSASSNELIIEHQGALIPLKVNEQTKFSGTTAQGEQVQSVDQIEQGSQVRASFKVQNETENVASSVELRKQGKQQKSQQQMQQ